MQEQGKIRFFHLELEGSPGLIQDALHRFGGLISQSPETTAEKPVPAAIATAAAKAKYTFDADVTRRDDGPYWAAALFLAIQSGDKSREELARRNLLRLGYRWEVSRNNEQLQEDEAPAPSPPAPARATSEPPPPPTSGRRQRAGQNLFECRERPGQRLTSKQCEQLAGITNIYGAFHTAKLRGTEWAEARGFHFRRIRSDAPTTSGDLGEAKPRARGEQPPLNAYVVGSASRVPAAADR